MKKYIVLLIVLFITPFVISQQSNVRRDSRGRISPPGIPRGATHEDAFALALKDPNIYIGVFENFQAGTKLTSGESLWSLPNVTQAMLKFIPLVCVKSIKGKFSEPIIWHSIIPAPRGEGSPPNRNSSFLLVRDSKYILAVKKTTKEEIIGRFGQEIEKYSYINENSFYDVLWYGYGALYLNWPEGREEREGIVKVNESMVDDLEAIAKVMPSIQKTTKDPNDTETINKMSLSLKNDLAKTILEKVITEKEQTPEIQGTRVRGQ